VVPTASVSAGPEATGHGGVTNSALLAVINTVGDDVYSTTDLSSLLNPTGTSPTQHYGPYPSTSPDSGTCDNDWANDTFDRHFTIKTDNATGAITVVEQFKSGSFVTFAGPSPGACETNIGGTIRAGVTGSMHGYFIIPMPSTERQTSNSPYCNAATSSNTDCTTTTFINTHFTPACYPAPCSVTTFFFHYAAGDQGLRFHEWRNASADRGGNSGDISNT
jgi:hypothetical protein